MDFGTTKWLGFPLLAGTPLKPKVQLFFLTLGILFLIKNDKRVNKRGLCDGQSQERKLSSNITT